MMLNAALIFFAGTVHTGSPPPAAPAPSLLNAQAPQYQQQQQQQGPGAARAPNAVVLSVPGGRYMIVNGKWTNVAGDESDANSAAPHVIGSSIPVPFTVTGHARRGRGGGRNSNISPPTVVPAD